LDLHGGILAGSLAIRPFLTADGPGGKFQAVVEGIYNFLDELAEGQIGHGYKKIFSTCCGDFYFLC